MCQIRADLSELDSNWPGECRFGAPLCFGRDRGKGAPGPHESGGAFGSAWVPCCLGNPLPPRLIFPFRARGPGVWIVVRPPVVDIADGDLAAVWIGTEFLEGPGKLQRCGADLIRLVRFDVPGHIHLDGDSQDPRCLHRRHHSRLSSAVVPTSRRRTARDSPAAPGEKLPARSPGELTVSRLRPPAALAPGIQANAAARSTRKVMEV